MGMTLIVLSIEGVIPVDPFVSQSMIIARSPFPVGKAQGVSNGKAARYR